MREQTMGRRPKTYSEFGPVSGIVYYGIVYAKSGHSFYIRDKNGNPFRSRSAAARAAEREQAWQDHVDSSNVFYTDFYVGINYNARWKGVE